MRRLFLILPWGRGLLPLLVGLFVWLRRAEGGAGLPAWAGSYLDDVVCLPLVLALVLTVHRLAGRPAQWTLPRSHGLASVVFFALYFELVLPLVKVTATADPLDVLAYAVGWLVFEARLNRRGAVAKDPAGDLALIRIPVGRRARARADV